MYKSQITNNDMEIYIVYLFQELAKQYLEYKDKYMVKIGGEVTDLIITEYIDMIPMIQKHINDEIVYHISEFYNPYQPKHRKHDEVMEMLNNFGEFIAKNNIKYKKGDQ